VPETPPLRAADAVREYALTMPGAYLTTPFGPATAVVKVAGRMFLLSTQAAPSGPVSLKCDPYWARALRRDYPSISPAWHLNKTHWIGLDLATGFEDEPPWALSDDLVADLVDQSYALVVAGLTRRARAALG
jgi:predicted DNA-binding protein (MmcQ/YjbR family)